MAESKESNKENAKEKALERKGNPLCYAGQKKDNKKRERKMKETPVIKATLEET